MSWSVVVVDQVLVVVVVVVERVWELPRASFTTYRPLVGIEEPLEVGGCIVDRVILIGEDQLEVLVVDSGEGQEIHCLNCMETMLQ